MAKRQSKRPHTSLPTETIPPPPDTQPEARGVVIGEPTEAGSAAEDYYKVIHAHRTVLAMKAVRPEGPAEASVVVVEDESGNGAQVLLQRVFAAERESADLRERLAEALHERDAARGEALRLSVLIDNVLALVRNVRPH